MTNTILVKASKGEKTLGAFVNINAPASVEILALAGLDYVIIDTEHGHYDIEKATELILAAEARGITAIARVRATERPAILKLLDAGAKGLLIPYIKTVAEAKQIVSWGKYRPVGDRGYGFTRAASYGHGQDEAGGIMEFFAAMNANTLLIPQCETAECLESIEEILAVPGIDGIFIGPFDLSISLGIAGQFGHETMLAAYSRVLKAAKDTGKLCYILATTPEDAKAKLAQGFDGVVSSDVGFLKSGAAEYVQGIRG
ncbi:MAG: aldolase/citrate lyase family protein [Symbiobacteriaceae bacterium]|nr:aldolase/citrate lyase family protein [Symbiobacteriaceae bacterium]